MRSMLKKRKLAKIYRDLSFQRVTKKCFCFARRLLFTSQATYGLHYSSNVLDPQDEKVQAFKRLLTFLVGLYLLQSLKPPIFKFPKNKRKNIPKKYVPNKWDIKTLEDKYIPYLKYHALQIWNEIIIKELAIFPGTVFLLNLFLAIFFPKKGNIESKKLGNIFLRLFLPRKEDFQSKKYITGFILLYFGIVLLVYMNLKQRTLFLCTLECTLKVGNEVKTLFYKSPDIYEF